MERTLSVVDKKVTTVVEKLVHSEGRFVDGYQISLNNTIIMKKEGVVSINVSGKVVMVISPIRNGKCFCKVRLYNRQAVNRISVIIDLFKWDGIDLIADRGINYIKTESGGRIKLDTAIFYTKEALLTLAADTDAVAKT